MEYDLEPDFTTFPHMMLHGELVRNMNKLREMIQAAYPAQSKAQEKRLAELELEWRRRVRAGQVHENGVF